MPSIIFAPLDVGGSEAMRFGVLTVRIHYHNGRPVRIESGPEERRVSWTEQDIRSTQPQPGVAE